MAEVRPPRFAAATDSASVELASAVPSTRSNLRRGIAGHSANVTITTATTRMACCVEVSDYDYGNDDGDDYDYQRSKLDKQTHYLLQLKCISLKICHF